jgi:hypothetical protein
MTMKTPADEIREHIEKANRPPEPVLTGATMAAELRTTATLLEAEAKRLKQGGFTEKRDRDGTVRNVDWMRFLAREFAELANRVHLP